MRVLQINSFGNIGTGKIVTDIAHTLYNDGHDCVVAYGRNELLNNVKGIRIGNSMSVYKHVVMTRITDKAGFYSKRATKELIKKIEAYHPDIIHLHNLHGYYINVELLFRYLAEKNIPVVWTLHDCWAFTGHCVHFEFVGCRKWLTHCCNCPCSKSYPSSILCDCSKKNFQKKKELFTGVSNMTLVTPSLWLNSLVENSFLSKYKVVTIHNGIDLSLFCPSPLSTWREKYQIGQRKIVLGVAATWAPWKGLEDFIKLSSALPDDYRIVVVGVSKKQQRELPDCMIGIERTHNAHELATIYSEAFCLVNPTYTDTFPTVNLEALACGTPVITYRTGGCPESINDSCGIVVEQGNIEELKDAILSINADQIACITQAQKFNREDCFRQYVNLYQQILKL